jgi:hypothetical protein
VTDREIKYVDMHLKFVPPYAEAVLEFGILDKAGKRVEAVATGPQDQLSISLHSAPRPDTMKDPQADEHELCTGNFLGGGGWKIDPATKRVRLEGTLRDGNQDCRQHLLDIGYSGKYFVHFWKGYSEANEETAVELPDDRPPRVAAIDAHVEKLERAMAAVDPAKQYPPCAAKHLVSKNEAGEDVIYSLDAIDHRAIGKPDDAPWGFLTTDLFRMIEEYKLRRSKVLPETLPKLFAMQPRVAVLVATKSNMPAGTGNHETFVSGVYDGRVVVVDPARDGPVCQVAFVGTSSDVVEFKKTTIRDSQGKTSGHDDAAWNMTYDFRAGIGKGIYAAMKPAGIEGATPRYGRPDK